MRLLRARADEFASLVDMNTRVLVAATQLIGQVQGQGVDAGMQELGTLLGGMQGVNFWIAERDGASGTATRSIGPASELAPLLTASQWGDLFAATSERPVLPTVRSTAPDGSILLGFATRLSDGRAAVLECNIREIADGVAGNDPGLEAALYFGPVAAAPLVIASTTHSGTVTEPSVSQVIRVNGGLPATLVVGGRVGASPSWLINAILLAGILIGLAAAAAVTALQRKRDLLAHHADHDELTGLANRRLFDRTVESLSADGAVGVVLFDLDGFKPINDLLGHACGDRALAMVADRLRGAIPADALPARLGGDEFAVCTPSISDGQLEDLARAVRANVAGPVKLDDQIVDIDLSIGVASWPGTSDSAAALLRDADMAMYVAKRSGPGSEPVSYFPSLAPRGPGLPGVPGLDTADASRTGRLQVGP
ncbi:MAG: GGDEF domain-containing protein [Actinobacteria bacterium]|nr:GGDEF domain-containing protein [Thermoleophilia bacterium]MCB9011841.1 GGDEF domain-containing protein [Actinomycetota bacterium]